MPSPKPLTKEQILYGMSHTLSNRACARFLNVGYTHYKRYAKMYKNEEGVSLFDVHKNPSGKGIRKWLGNTGRVPPLLDLINGIIPVTSFSPEKVKRRLFAEGYLREECYICKFSERRVLDYKIPLLLHFKDKNKKNYRLDNLQVLCYNHYFLLVEDVFKANEIAQIEDSVPKNNTTELINWELDDGSDLISRI
jgi:hypothetical protein